MSRPLYHFTCNHHVNQIAGELVLRPGLDGLVWLTDLPWPRRNALGLTSHILDCDRTARRFTVADQSDVITFDEWSASDRILAAALAATPGATPQHWYVSTSPVPVMAGRRLA